jgi:hypothetical protein
MSAEDKDSPPPFPCNILPAVIARVDSQFEC